METYISKKKHIYKIERRCVRRMAHKGLSATSVCFTHVGTTLLFRNTFQVHSREVLHFGALLCEATEHAGCRDFLLIPPPWRNNIGKIIMRHTTLAL